MSAIVGHAFGCCNSIAVLHLVCCIAFLFRSPQHVCPIIISLLIASAACTVLCIGAVGWQHHLSHISVGSATCDVLCATLHLLMRSPACDKLHRINGEQASPITCIALHQSVMLGSAAGHSSPWLSCSTAGSHLELSSCNIWMTHTQVTMSLGWRPRRPKCLPQTQNPGAPQKRPWQT